MRELRQFTAVIEQEGDGFVALCPELDIASQGDTIEVARANLTEAVDLFLTSAKPSEVRNRLHGTIADNEARVRYFEEKYGGSFEQFETSLLAGLDTPEAHEDYNDWFFWHEVLRGKGN